jgi:hypothetical protein
MPRAINHRSTILTRKEAKAYRRELIRRGFSQNSAAREIGRTGSILAKWLNGVISSEPLRKQINELLERTSLKP